MAERENFSSGLTAVLAMAGSAIGLGNIWRFPYMVGQNGGAAYILVYLVCTLLLSLPIFYAESIIGRHSSTSVMGAMDKLFPGKGKLLRVLAFPTVLSPLILLSFYSVVGGWSVRYLAVSVISGFGTSYTSDFTQFCAQTYSPIIFHSIFLVLCAVVVLAGIKSGIEKFNKFTIPVLFVLILCVMIFSIAQPGASAGIEYLVKPDFSRLDSSSIASAMGQSFFSLSLGVGTILTYSSYMKKSENILSTGIGTAFFDLMFAILAGFAIMPAVFAAGIEPGAGPGLIFETIPYIFSKMSAGSVVVSRIISIVFFLSIFISALTSAISMLEVGVTYLVDQRKVSRKFAVIVLFLGIWGLGACCAANGGLFDTLDMLTSDYLMAFGGLLFTIIVGWGMKKDKVYDELRSGGHVRIPKVVLDIVFSMIRYVAPIAIVVIFITNLIL